ncbi:MAG: hypothetical protein K6G90_06955 [Clostridia bacterium]|nr:hypothetical protein [Clostridia bacterium]
MMKKAIAIFVTLLLLVGVFSACGGNSDGDKADNSDANVEAEAENVKSVPGETKSWGKLSVLVPEGYTFKEGTMSSDTDENGVRLINDNEMWDYMYFTVMDIETAENNVQYSLEGNSSYDAKSVDELKTGDKTWTGETHSDADAGWTAYAVYTKLDDSQVIYALVCTKDIDTMNAVLASVRLS